MKTLQQLFDVEFPLVQAPMAGVQASALAIAVSNAGALGSLPCAMLSLESIRDELNAIRANGAKPYSVNFFCHQVPEPDADREMRWREKLSPYYAEFGIDVNAITAGPGRRPFDDEAADVLEEFKPPILSFHFGLPAERLMKRVHGWGSKVIASATTVDEARWLEQRSVDVIIAQGVEAGGHRGNFLSNDITNQVGTFSLVPQIVNAVNVPVIAAGGIADQRGIAAAIKLGASGVQLGTTYLLCTEATTSALHRAALASDAARVTALTNLFTGRPARGIVNRYIRELGAMRNDVPAFPLATSAITPLRAAAEKLGSSEFTPLWAGQNVSGCKAVSATTLTRELTQAFS